MSKHSRSTSSSYGTSKPEAVLPMTNMRAVRNTSFVGRDDKLERIHRYLRDPHGNPPYVVISGHWGVGKSRAALEYACRYCRCYRAVFWLNCQDEEKLGRSYAEIARILEANEASPGSTHSTNAYTTCLEQIEFVRKWFNKNDQWLLIFNNVIDTRLIELPDNAREQGSVIVTTEDTNNCSFYHVFYKIRFVPLSTTDGARLLLQTMERENVDEQDVRLAHQIAKCLGELPLAIVLFGTCAKCSSLKLDQAACDLVGFTTARHCFNSSINPGGVETREGKDILDMSLEAASYGIRSQGSQELLQVMARMDPDEILKEDLERRLRSEDCYCIDDGDKYAEAQRDLCSRQLIERHQSPDGIFFTMAWTLRVRRLPTAECFEAEGRATQSQIAQDQAKVQEQVLGKGFSVNCLIC